MEELEFLDSAMEAATQAVEEARKILLKYFGHLSKIDSKNKAGLVTEADKESEFLVRKKLKEKFPSFSILGEEEGLKEPLSKEPGLWIIDPLDGTTNYVHQFPVFCISLGLEWKGEIVLGVVDAPLLNRRYVAKKGQGAFVNERRLKVSETKKLDQALLATGIYPYGDPKDFEWQIHLFGNMVKKSRGVRRAGSAALDLCLVAEGVFDAFWEKNLKPWDIAAGWLMIKEAGGKVVDYQGKDFDLNSPSILASNPSLLQKMLFEIQSLSFTND